ncbi:uncharacterized protein LOC132204526 [Neocloeon triangulifer]|uniref:uncharacterized protein LOC132204526 n=1 Tax=Neocloeon triangulifer TaxID=2078957 RepID=UPI00286F40C9|nr:uncharacterized protein LOC132204526 [Neocloeon triangulifer]
MTLLTITSVDEMDCLASVKGGTYWTSGSNEETNCDVEKKYAWCSTGYNISVNMISLANFWTTPNVTSNLERCLAYSNSGVKKGLAHKNCNDTFLYICQYNVDCPKICSKNLNWLANWQQCCAIGMETLSIDNLLEQSGLTNFSFINKDNWKANFNYWTSGTQKGSPANHWSWCRPDGGPTTLNTQLVWEQNQPDNNGGNENCVHFRFILNDTGTILTDRNCTSKYIFACKTPLKTTAKSCKADCPLENCTRNETLFNTNYELKNYNSYGDWFSSCGRHFLFYVNASDWNTAWGECCQIGLNLATLESAGKSTCVSKLTAQYSSFTNGDWWVSGSDINCDKNFQWCSINRAFVESEIKWKSGHPKAGLDCVYVEIRNSSILLATADCKEKKRFLCEVRRDATFGIGMQTECAEIWDIKSEEIDLLMNATAITTANISINLKVETSVLIPVITVH